MSKKIDLRIVILIIIALFIAENAFFNFSETPKEVTVIVPSKSGKKEMKLDSSVRFDTISISVKTKKQGVLIKKQIVVDSLYKAKYELAIKENDSLSAKNLFLQSISIENWEGTMIDNEDVKIDGKFVTRGKLLEYSIDYKVKEDTITYTPEVVTMLPRMSLVGGVEVGFSTSPIDNIDPLISMHLGLRNKKGNTFTVGLDSQKRVTAGIEFTLFKTKR